MKRVNRRALNSILSGLVVTMAAVTTLPAAEGPKLAEQVAARMLELQTKIDEILAQTDSTIASLKALSSAKPEDRPVHFKVYQKALAGTNKTHGALHKAIKKAHSQRESYMKTWQKDQAKIVNPTLKAAGEARRAELVPIIDKIQDSLQKCGAAYDPMLQDLNDIDLFLKNDLAAVATPEVANLISDSDRSAGEVRAHAAEAKAAIGDLATRISPYKA